MFQVLKTMETEELPSKSFGWITLTSLLASCFFSTSVILLTYFYCAYPKPSAMPVLVLTGIIIQTVD